MSSVRPPLWRLKANYVLRELVRALHGRPHDTAVMWGLEYALADILHTFAKENALPIPKLVFWYGRFWAEFSRYLGERLFTPADSGKFLDVLRLGFPPSKADLCEGFLYDPVIYCILHLASVMALLGQEGAATVVAEGWPLRYYEALPIAPLDSFTIWYMKRVHGALTEC